MAETVMVQFECIDLPFVDAAHQRLGIQERQEVIQDVAVSAGATARFTFSLAVTVDDAGSQPGFKGSMVQGPRQQPFIYLCWGERVAGDWITARRAKFPLSALTRQHIAQALEANRPIRVKIRMTTATGVPVAASLKPEQYAVSVSAPDQANP